MSVLMSMTRVCGPRPLVAAFQVVWVLVALSGCSSQTATGAATQELTLGDQTFELELALDDDARVQGLSDREHIDADGGMLFVFPDAYRRAFVMRRCLVPIDLIFLDANGRVDSMHQMPVEDDPFKPDHELTRYPSRGGAQFAIELAGGTLDGLDLRLGQRVQLPLEALKARAQ